MKSNDRIVVIMLCSLLCAVMASGCASNMLYYPTHRNYGNPSDRGLAYEKVTFESQDGTGLTGWFMPAVGKAKGTVIHYHGNAQNISAHYSYVSWLPRRGFNTFVFDYRGYGASNGEPNRKGVYEDSCAAIDYLRSRDNIDTNKILVLGQSLGGANALAALRGTGMDGVQAVAVDSAFYSYRLIVRDKIKLMPVLGLFRWPLSFLVISNAKSPSSTIEHVTVPLLILHGTHDQVIPYRHGQLLFDRAHDPKEMLTTPNGRHTEALVHSDPRYRDHLVAFFEQALQKREGS
jgi:fermentation-respiration switch protein FrsA (DUF1100 family)